MSDYACFGSQQRIALSRVTVDHGDSLVTVTATDLYGNTGVALLTPTESRALAQDLLRRADLIEKEGKG